MLKFVQTFVVVGCGEFPYDMLRYDHCFPIDEAHSRLLSADFNDTPRRAIIMMRYVEFKKSEPTGRTQTDFR